MSAFQSPNHTQTPNDFFDMVNDMSDAELRVTLVMIRQTFGFHRDDFKMGINKIAGLAGLSRNGAKQGVKDAENRGTFRRANPDSLEEAEWILVIEDGQPVTTPPSASDQGDGQPVTRGWSASEGQVGVKERLKKSLNKNGATTPKASQIPELVLFRKVVGRYPSKPSFQTVINAISQIKTRLGRDVTDVDLSPFLTAWTDKGWNPTNLAWLTEWAVPGSIPQRTNGKIPTQSTTPQPMVTPPDKLEELRRQADAMFARGEL
jgi:hypothetical protein